MFLLSLAVVVLFNISLPFIIPSSIKKKMILADFIALCAFFYILEFTTIAWLIIKGLI